MDILSEYSGGILQNINVKHGFLSKNSPDVSPIIRSNTSLVKRKSSSTKSISDPSSTWFRIRPVRRVSYKCSDSSDSDEDYAPSPRPKVQRKSYAGTELDVAELDNVERRLGLNKRPNQYGSVEGVVVGQWWKTRMECSFSGTHRPTVSGIHAGPNGAYSVALSGGYEGDIDAGDEFTYTGEGGRDLKGTKANPKDKNLFMREEVLLLELADREKSGVPKLAVHIRVSKTQIADILKQKETTMKL